MSVSRENKQSLWMQGLLYAEEVGIENAIELVKNDFDNSICEFKLGIEAYIEYFNAVNNI